MRGVEAESDTVASQSKSAFGLSFAMSVNTLKTPPASSHGCSYLCGKTSHGNVPRAALTPTICSTGIATNILEANHVSLRPWLPLVTRQSAAHAVLHRVSLACVNCNDV